jgi:hypothetical protein
MTISLLVRWFRSMGARNNERTTAPPRQHPSANERKSLSTDSITTPVAIDAAAAARMIAARLNPSQRFSSDLRSIDAVIAAISTAENAVAPAAITARFDGPVIASAPTSKTYRTPANPTMDVGLHVRCMPETSISG